MDMLAGFDPKDGVRAGADAIDAEVCGRSGYGDIAGFGRAGHQAAVCHFDGGLIGMLFQ